jgi:hypothetical protein
VPLPNPWNIEHLRKFYPYARQKMNFCLCNEVAPTCGPERWRSALINPAFGVHRTAHMYQVIKEKKLSPVLPL